MVQSIEDYSLYNISNRIAGEQQMKTSVKVSMKAQKIAGALSRMLIQNFNHLQVYFCRIRQSLVFFGKGAWRQVCNTRTCVHVHRKHHISMQFLRRTASHFAPKEKISCFGKKIPSFQIIQERSCPSATLFGKTIFSERLKKISNFHVFF